VALVMKTADDSTQQSHSLIVETVLRPGKTSTTRTDTAGSSSIGGAQLGMKDAKATTKQRINGYPFPFSVEASVSFFQVALT